MISGKVNALSGRRISTNISSASNSSRGTFFVVPCTLELHLSFSQVLKDAHKTS